MNRLANFVAASFLGILLIGAALSKQDAKPANATPPGFPPAPAKETADVGPPPDQSLGTTKCQCSGPVDCTCEICKCENGNECKPAYKPIVKLCDAAAKGNCDCKVCECDGDKQCTKQGVVSPVKCGFCAGLGQVKCQPCDGSGYEPPKAEPKYTQPQPAKPAPVKASSPEYVMVWQQNYGPLGRPRGGQWVRVLKSQARPNTAQPVRTYYRGSCTGGFCR